MEENDADCGAAYAAQALALRDQLLAEGADHEAPSSAPPLLHAACRVRPVLPSEEATFGARIPGMGAASFAQFEYLAALVDKPRNSVVVLSEERRIGKPTGSLINERVATDTVFGDKDGDDQVYASCVAPLVESVRGGGRAALIAFGQTGAGKTHTSIAMQRRAALALLSAADAEVAAAESGSGDGRSVGR